MAPLLLAVAPHERKSTFEIFCQTGKQTVGDNLKRDARQIKMMLLTVNASY
jgi:hypothetical protein